MGWSLLGKTDTCGPNGCPEFAEHSISQGISIRPSLDYLRDEFEKDNDRCVVGLPPSFPISRVIRIALVPSYKAVFAQNESMVSQLLTEGFDRAVFHIVFNGTEKSNWGFSLIVFDLWLIHLNSRRSCRQ